MKSKPPASQERTVLANPTNNKLDVSLGSEIAGADGNKSGPANPDYTSVIMNEFLKLITKLTEDKPEPSKTQKFSTHPLTIVGVSFLLSVPLGGFITYLYTVKQMELEKHRDTHQQELVRQRSFSDELNKIRIQKIGEVWEQIDKNEVEIDDLLDRTNKPSDSNQKDFDNIVKLVKEDVSMIDRNRFWLGEQTSNRLKKYLSINSSYALDKLLGPPGIDLSDTIKRREEAKQDILQIRSMFLKGEPEP